MTIFRTAELSPTDSSFVDGNTPITILCSVIYQPTMSFLPSFLDCGKEDEEEIAKKKAKAKITSEIDTELKNATL